MYLYALRSAQLCYYRFLQTPKPPPEEETPKKSGGGGLFGGLFGPSPAAEGTTFTLQGKRSIKLVAGEPKASLRALQLRLFAAFVL